MLPSSSISAVPRVGQVAWPFSCSIAETEMHRLLAYSASRWGRARHQWFSNTQRLMKVFRGDLFVPACAAPAPS